MARSAISWFNTLACSAGQADNSVALTVDTDIAPKNVINKAITFLKPHISLPSIYVYLAAIISAEFNKNRVLIAFSVIERIERIMLGLMLN
ncbi:hypothetical protein [Serratia sp. (in: enterobacteria)]|uniref:hypothetical protein n=1 Tax=Serratia sp. (in: enterobacteria) TaxID=616 RepID=UPI003989B35B